MDGAVVGPLVLITAAIDKAVAKKVLSAIF